MEGNLEIIVLFFSRFTSRRVATVHVELYVFDKLRHFRYLG